jgi:hypothetical protein
VAVAWCFVVGSAILLRKAADQTGLTAGLSGALRKKSTAQFIKRYWRPR